MSKQDHEDLRSLSPDYAALARHPMQPFIKGDEIDLTGLPVPKLIQLGGQEAQYRPTLPPVAHDPLNMRDHEPNLRALYPKLKELGDALAATEGSYESDPIKRALRQELSGLAHTATGRLIGLQRSLYEQRTLQTEFNQAYADIEAILAKFPEMLKP